MVQNRMDYSSEELKRFGALSRRLQEILAAGGYPGGKGIRLVSQLARQHDLRDWLHTQTVEDYEALIRVVQEHIEGQKRPETLPAACLARDCEVTE